MPLLIAVGVAVVLVVPLALMALHRGTGQIDWISPISTGSVKGFLYGLVVPRFPTWLRWLMLIAIVTGLVQTSREVAGAQAGSHERWCRVLLLSWAAVPLLGLLAISFSVSLLQSDYLIASVPAFAVLAAIGTKTIAKWAGEGAARGVAAMRPGARAHPRTGPGRRARSRPDRCS